MATERIETVGPLPFCTVCCSSISSSSASSESSGLCSVVCISGAGTSRVNGTYTLTDAALCLWTKDGDPDVTIQYKTGTLPEPMVIAISGTDQYQSTTNVSGCVCPSTLTWETTNGQAPVPTAFEGPCPSSSSSSAPSESSSSVSPPSSSSVSESSTSEGCDQICVSGAGEPQVNGTYTRVNPIIDPCKWEGPNGYYIEPRFDGVDYHYDLTNGSTVEYTTTDAFGEDECPCPDTLAWETFSGDAPAPTVERGPCPGSSSSSQSSPSEPCDFICVNGAGTSEVNGLYTRDGDNCEWNGPNGFKIVKRTDINSYRIQDSGGDPYYVTTQNVPDDECPCPASNSWITDTEGASPAPTLTLGPDCPSASSSSISSESSAAAQSSAGASSESSGPCGGDCDGTGQGTASVSGTDAILGLNGTYTFVSRSGNTWTWDKGGFGTLEVVCCDDGSWCGRLTHAFTVPFYGGDDCPCQGAGWKDITGSVSCTGGVLTGSFTLDPRAGAGGSASVTL